MSDVVLVFMPYGTADRPSIGLGYLSAELKEIGISSKVIHGTLNFAKKIGLGLYNRINVSSNLDLIGEWTFSKALFPDFEPNHQEYFEFISKAIPTEDLLKVRNQTVEFVDEIALEVLAENPKIVGCSTMFQQNCSSLALLRKIKELKPDVITVLGGANCEKELGCILHTYFPFVDYLFSGDGDESFPLFCKKALNYDLDDMSEFKDYVFYPQNRDIGLERKAGISIVHNIDKLPTPDFQDYFEDLSKKEMDKEIFPALLLETSRGCWWGEKVRCTFCGLSQDIIDFRSKSANRAMSEINELYEKYNIPLFELVDNILDKKYYETLLPKLAEDRRDLKFFYEIKANVNKREVQLLADAGIFWVQPGIESLNDKILKLLKKGAMSYHNIQLLKWCREYGILVSWNYLADVPNEKDEWYVDEIEMVPLLEHFQAPWNSGTPIRYDRFSVYALNQKEYGLDLVPTKAYDYIYDLTKEQISNLAYFFENRNLSIVNDGKERPNWEKLKDIMGKWRDKFYVLNDLGYLTEEPLSQDVLPNLLIMEDNNSKMVIKDTRSCAVFETLELNGLEAEVYRVCDEALSLGSIVMKLKEKYEDIAHNEIENILKSLMQKKIVINISSRYLSLALKNPIRDYFRF